MPRGDAPLAAGHVLTIEPGLYAAGVGGIRLEDDVAVTDGESGPAVGHAARVARARRLRGPARVGGEYPSMLCALTGNAHRLFWMRSAWWCTDCRQKIESCCEGGGCPSVADA